jgi:hypothetical protein
MQHSQLLFNLENQTMDFSYSIFPVKKINVGKILKLWENCYFNYSLYSHPEIGNFRVWQITSIRNIETAGVRERSRLQNKKSWQRRWPILKCIALSVKNVLHYKCFLQVLYLATQLPKITKGKLVGSRRPGGRSESMLHFFDSAFFLFSSSLFSCSRTTLTAT